MSGAEQLVLIDGSGYIFRAFHALPPMTRGDGTPVNAVYGFTGMVMKLMNNFIVFMNTSALAEALLIGTRAGVDGELFGGVGFEGLAFGFGFHAGHEVVSAFASAGDAGFGFVNVFFDFGGFALGDDEVFVAFVFGKLVIHRGEFLFELVNGGGLAFPL